MDGWEGGFMLDPAQESYRAYLVAMKAHWAAVDVEAVDLRTAARASGLAAGCDGTAGTLGTAGTVGGCVGTVGTLACFGSHGFAMSRSVQAAGTAGTIGTAGTAGSIGGTIGTAASIGTAGSWGLVAPMAAARLQMPHGVAGNFMTMMCQNTYHCSGGGSPFNR